MIALPIPLQPFPSFQDLLHQSSSEEAIGLGIWSDNSLVIWLKSKGNERWLGILDEKKVAVEAHFFVQSQEIASLTLKGNAIGDGVEGFQEPMHRLERVASMAHEFSKTMNATIVISARALENAHEISDDDTPSTFWKELRIAQNLLCVDGLWLPTEMQREEMH